MKAPNHTRSHFMSMTSVAILAGTAVGFAPSAADVAIDPQLQLAAKWHAWDMLHNRNLNGDIGSDGGTPRDRATAARLPVDGALR